MAELTEAAITIAAPARRVMAVIADLAAYPDWNDEVKAVEVLATGAGDRPTRVRFVLDSGAIRDTYTLAYSWHADEGVSWSLVGEAQVLTRMDGSYALREVAGHTEVTYRLAVDVTVPMIGLIKRKAERVVVDRALKGLKKRVES